MYIIILYINNIYIIKVKSFKLITDVVLLASTVQYAAPKCDDRRVLGVQSCLPLTLAVFPGNRLHHL